MPDGRKYTYCKREKKKTTTYFSENWIYWANYEGKVMDETWSLSFWILEPSKQGDSHIRKNKQYALKVPETMEVNLYIGGGS